LSNAKTYESKKEGSRVDSIKSLTDIKSEATSLSATIKKSLSQALTLSKQLKEKINGLKAKEAEKLAQQKAPEVDVKKESVEPSAVQQKDTVIAKTSTEQKPVIKNNSSVVAQKNDRQQGRFPQSGNRQFSQNKGDGNFRTRHFNDANQEGSQRGFAPRDNRNGFQKNTQGGAQRGFGMAGANNSRPQNGVNGNRPQNKPFGSTRPMQTGGSTVSFDMQQKNKVDNSKTQPKRKTNEHSFEEKKSLNRKALVMRGFIADESLENEDGVMMGSRKIKSKKAKQQETVVAQVIEHAVITTENLTVKLLAEKIGKPVVEIIKKFMILGNMVNINSTINFDEAELIAGEFGVTLEQKLEKTAEQQLNDIKNITDDENDLEKRPPVVTVMGHVDHGKTSLLDYIRETNVIAGEAGGITQHIGAYTIEKNNEMITFIDTPGHAAFTAMRERGAKMTDIAILVVAADDGVMPQTVEAINEIKQVKAPMIVAINKIDKPEANVDRIKQQLTEHDVIPEEWGGDAILIPISAKTGQNIDKLSEMILFVAEYQNLRANPKRKAIGTVIEAKLDKGMGPMATILVQNGTLKVGDVIIAGTSVGKVRAMINEKGKNVKSAGPSYAVSVLGLSSVPSAGDEMYAVDEKMSKKVQILSFHI
jgi:translation initiation factor IF-2